MAQTGGHMRSIDLNSDLGEGFGPWAMGDDAAMLGLVTSANVACGGHASDPETMFATLRLAAQNGVTVGAHPGYNDREGFGRRIIPMTPSEITRMVAAQIGTLMGLAALAGTKVAYVKAHGALANLAADPSSDTPEAITASGGSERDVLSKVMGVFKVRVAQLHELGEAIPWIDPPLPRLENEQIRSVPMHL